MADEPLFNERVPANDPNLPAELQGKSAAEVAAFYRTRETQIVKEANDRIAAAVVVPAAVKTPDSGDFWKDPAKAVRDQVAATSVSREEFQRASNSVQANMIEMSEFLVAQKFSDWKIFKPMIDDIMSKCDPWAKTDRTMWESAYYYAKGRNPQLIQQPTAPATVIASAERGNPAPINPGPAAPVLTTDEAWVADHLGITSAEYSAAKENMGKIGSLPLTYDNRNIRPVGAK